LDRSKKETRSVSLASLDRAVVRSAASVSLAALSVPACRHFLQPSEYPCIHRKVFVGNDFVHLQRWALKR
jgi:hypothetical protein